MVWGLLCLSDRPMAGDPTLGQWMSAWYDLDCPSQVHAHVSSARVTKVLNIWIGEKHMHHAFLSLGSCK